MEYTPSSPSAPPPTPAVAGILARARRAVTPAVERLLVERLHRVLDEGGSAAIRSLAETLPPLQELMSALPDVVAEGASPAVLDAAQTLGRMAQERRIALANVMAEGLQIHNRLLHEIAADLRTDDLALVTALLQISRSLLDVELTVLLSYQQEADAALKSAVLVDPVTGLASWPYFKDRLAEHVQLARRIERPLALTLITAGRAGAPPAAAAQAADAPYLRVCAAFLRAQIRTIDLAAHRNANVFALLLPGTDRAGTAALLDRLTQGAAAQQIPLHLNAGTAISEGRGLTGDALLEQAEQELFGAGAGGA